MKQIKSFFKKYPYAYTLFIGLALLVWFRVLEHVVTVPKYNLHVPLDDKIPFISWFSVPYLLWFPYIGVVMAYFFLRSGKDFMKASAFLYIGMSVCYIVYMIWPNGQDLRPELTGGGVGNWIVSTIYAGDTPYNCFPSIHVINSIGIHTAVAHYDGFKYPKLVKGASFVMMLSICLATVFIKQHSIIDVVAGAAVSAVLYVGIYVINWQAIREKKVRTETVS